MSQQTNETLSSLPSGLKQLSKCLDCNSSFAVARQKKLSKIGDSRTKCTGIRVETHMTKYNKFTEGSVESEIIMTDDFLT